MNASTLLHMRINRMTLTNARGISAALLAAVSVVACSSGPRRAVQTSAQPAPSEQGDAAGIAKARADSVRYPYTADDVHFMSGMIGHHAQAVVMSGWGATHGARPSVRILAERIINGQQDEIATIQLWLRDRQKPVPKADGSGMMTMMIDGAEHKMVMPGMLSDVQMKQLDQARGKEFDRLFLSFMIQHHRGAVAMVKELFGSYGAGQDETVFKFASDVSVDQTTEIARMEQMLASLNLESRPR